MIPVSPDPRPSPPAARASKGERWSCGPRGQRLDSGFRWTKAIGIREERDDDGGGYDKDVGCTALPRRRAFHISTTMGSTLTKMIPSTTSSKFFFTTGMLPKKKPANAQMTTHATAPTTL